MPLEMRPYTFHSKVPQNHLAKCDFLFTELPQCGVNERVNKGRVKDGGRFSAAPEGVSALVCDP
jgi:hypothetical protein